MSASPRYILINHAIGEVRAALVSGGRLMALSYFRDSEPSLVGQKYNARVRRINKELDGAFLDLGDKQEAFLPARHARRIAPHKKPRHIGQSVFEGQLIIIEIVRDALVGDNKLAVARAIAAPEPAQSKALSVGCLQPLPSSLVRAAMAFAPLEGDQVLVDSTAALGELKHHVGAAELHLGPVGFFEAEDIDATIDQVISGEIALKSGGTLTLDETRAVTLFDVNSGSGGKGRGAEQVRLNTNLEALSVIADTLRIFNIGGLMVVDFIDLEGKASINSLNKSMDRVFSHDSAAIERTGLSRFGLVEIKRSRRGQSLLSLLGDRHGGYNVRAQAYALLRAGLKAGEEPGAGEIELAAPVAVIDWLQANQHLLDKLKRRTARELVLNVLKDGAQPRAGRTGNRK